MEKKVKIRHTPISIVMVLASNEFSKNTELDDAEILLLREVWS